MSQTPPSNPDPVRNMTPAEAREFLRRLGIEMTEFELQHSVATEIETDLNPPPTWPPPGWRSSTRPPNLLSFAIGHWIAEIEYGPP